MMRQADRHARGLALRHVVDWIAVAAEPANQHPVRDVVTLVKLVTLAAGVEDRANLAVVAAREQKTQPLARAISSRAIETVSISAPRSSVQRGRRIGSAATIATTAISVPRASFFGPSFFSQILRIA